MPAFKSKWLYGSNDCRQIGSLHRCVNIVREPGGHRVPVADMQHHGHATDYAILDASLRESAGEALHDFEELVHERNHMQ